MKPKVTDTLKMMLKKFGYNVVGAKTRQRMPFKKPGTVIRILS